MRFFLLLLLLLCCVAPSLRAQDPPPKKAYPEIGSDIPGPFKPYNISDPRKKGFAKRYHCLVSEHGLNPTVAVFSRTTELSQIKPVLLLLDMLVDKNPRTRLAGFAVFVDDKMTNPATEDDKREAMELTVTGIHDQTKFKHVALALDSAKNVEKYKVDEDAAVTIVLYKDYRVAGYVKIKAEDLADDKILAKVAEVEKVIRKAFIPEN